MRQSVGIVPERHRQPQGNFSESCPRMLIKRAGGCYFLITGALSGPPRNSIPAPQKSGFTKCLTVELVISVCSVLINSRVAVVHLLSGPVPGTVDVMLPLTDTNKSVLSVRNHCGGGKFRNRACGCCAARGGWPRGCHEPGIGSGDGLDAPRRGAFSSLGPHPDAKGPTGPLASQRRDGPRFR